MEFSEYLQWDRVAPFLRHSVVYIVIILFPPLVSRWGGGYSDGQFRMSAIFACVTTLQRCGGGPCCSSILVLCVVIFYVVFTTLVWRIQMNEYIAQVPEVSVIGCEVPAPAQIHIQYYIHIPILCRRHLIKIFIIKWYRKSYKYINITLLSQ